MPFNATALLNAEGEYITPARFTYISSASTVAAKSSAGVLYLVTVGTGSAGSISVYDADNATTDPIAVIDTAAAGHYTFGPYGIAASNGLTFVTVGTAKVTVAWK